MVRTQDMRKICNLPTWIIRSINGKLFMTSTIQLILVRIGVFWNPMSKIRCGVQWENQNRASSRCRTLQRICLRGPQLNILVMIIAKKSWIEPLRPRRKNRDSSIQSKSLDIVHGPSYPKLRVRFRHFAPDSYLVECKSPTRCSLQEDEMLRSFRRPGQRWVGS